MSRLKIKSKYMNKQQFELQINRFSEIENNKATIDIYWDFWCAMEYAKPYNFSGDAYHTANHLFHWHLLTKEINPIVSKANGYSGDKILFTRKFSDQ